MKVLILNACVVTLLSAFWAQADFLDPQVKYKISLSVQRDPVLLQLDRVLSYRNFLPLIGRGLQVAYNSLDLMDRVYLPKNESPYGEAHLQYIFVKQNILVLGSVQYQKVYHLPDAYLVHFQRPDGTALAIYFKGMSLEKVSILQAELQKVFGGSNSASRSFSLFSWSQARAQSGSDPAGSVQAACADQALQAPLLSSSNQHFAQLWNCAKAFGGGVYNSTAGAAVSLGQGLKNLTLNPQETFAQASESFKQIKNMLYNIEATFGDLKSSFQSLPEEVRTQVGCEILGSLSTSALVTFFTVGSGSPILLRSIASALNKVATKLPRKGKAKVVNKLFDLSQKMQDKADRVQASMDYLKAKKQIFKDSRKKGVSPKELAQDSDYLDDLLFKDGVLSATWVPSMDVKELLADPAFVKTLQESDPAFLKQVKEWQKNKQISEDLKSLVQAKQKMLDLSKAWPTQERAVLTTYLASGACATVSSVQQKIKSSQPSDSLIPASSTQENKTKGQK